MVYLFIIVSWFLILDMAEYKVRMLLNNSLEGASNTIDVNGFSVDNLDDFGFVEFGKGIYEWIAALTNGEYDQILSLMLILVEDEGESIEEEYKTGGCYIVEIIDEWQDRFGAVLMNEV